MTFPDHFSPVAAQYAASRPRYPDALFAFLAEASPSRRRLWDAGCGSGQASVGLAAHFDRVVATDASALQIANAEPHQRIEYSVAAGTNAALADHSIDLARWPRHCTGLTGRPLPLRRRAFSSRRAAGRTTKRAMCTGR